MEKTFRLTENNPQERFLVPVPELAEKTFMKHFRYMYTVAKPVKF